MTAMGHQQGFSIVSAIFLVVILAALGAFMVSLSTTQHVASSLDVRGARAYQAARAGIEWGAWQALKNSAAYGCTGGASSAALSFTGDLADYTVTVTCTSSAFDEVGNTVRVYALTSTATSGVAGTVGYVARVLEASVALCTAPGGGAC
jgi:MSHA biogenesis protein MshP